MLLLYRTLRKYRDITGEYNKIEVAGAGSSWPTVHMQSSCMLVYSIIVMMLDNASDAKHLPGINDDRKAQEFSVFC